MEKALCLIRWFIFVVPLGVFSFLTSPILYPMAYLMRNLKPNILWIYLNDSSYNKDGSFAKDYKLWLINNGGLNETFVQKYKWHALRNRTYNLVNLIKPKQGKEIIYNMINNDLIFKGQSLKINNDTKHIYFASLKFIDKHGNKGWNVNQGEYISYNHTIHGKSFYYYTIDKTLYFRFSLLKLYNIPIIGKRWITVKAGTNKDRYIFTFKINKPKEWK